MDVVNLGAVDGLPPVDWPGIVEELGAGSRPAPDAHNARTTWLATINEDGSPHVTAVGCHLARWHVLVPDWHGNPEGPQRRARSALFDRRVDSRRRRRNRG
jgi:hypothetical protein